MPFCPHCGSRVGDADTLCRSCGQTFTPDTTPKKTGIPIGIWLAIAGGCVVVGIAFIGIISALLIPNFLDALNKAKQKRTVADLRQTGVELVSYFVDHEVFPEVDSIEDLSSVLGAERGTTVATLDAWKRPFRYECWRETESAPGCTHFVLASAGRDGVFEHATLAEYQEQAFDPIDYDRDLVLVDGLFIQYPRSPAEVKPEREPN